MSVVGVVLAGGRSRRMGTDKALLTVDGTTLLERTVTVLAQVVGPVVVVAATGQTLPSTAAVVLRDELPDTGPLHPLALGLAEAARLGADTALVTATDLPRLHPALLRVLLGHARPGTVVLPVLAGRDQLLTALWPTALAVDAHVAVAAGQRRVRDLLAAAEAVTRLDDAALLADEELRAVDPQLDGLRGANTPAEWAALVGPRPVGGAL